MTASKDLGVPCPLSQKQCWEVLRLGTSRCCTFQETTTSMPKTLLDLDTDVQSLLRRPDINPQQLNQLPLPPDFLSQSQSHPASPVLAQKLSSDQAS